MIFGEPEWVGLLMLYLVACHKDEAKVARKRQIMKRQGDKGSTMTRREERIRRKERAGEEQKSA